MITVTFIEYIFYIVFIKIKDFSIISSDMLVSYTKQNPINQILKLNKIIYMFHMILNYLRNLPTIPRIKKGTSSKATYFSFLGTKITCSKC